jgi:hypothetical protein
MSTSGSDITIPKPPSHLCTGCNRPYRLGELSCPTCGIPFMLTNIGKTRKVGQTGTIQNDRSWSLSITNPLDIMITLEIEGQRIELPKTKNLIVGRINKNNPTLQVPDIDLSRFNGEEKGVSRQHLRISRDALITVADLGSTNGTYLNGQRLFLNSDCPLSDGDDLRIGRLKARIKFDC